MPQPQRRTILPARSRRRLIAIPAAALALAGLAGLAAGCSSAAADQGHASASASKHAPAENTAKRKAAALLACRTSVFNRMTQAQRVGQLFLVGLPGNEVDTSVADTIKAEHFGSVIFGTTSHAGVRATRSVTSAVQALATSQTTAGVRFFISANQEGGEVQGLQGSGFSAIPAATSQGQLTTAALQKDAAGWGRQLRSAGVNLDLAPVMDVVPAGTAAENQPVGVLHRELGNTPSTAGQHGAAFIRGLAQAGVASTAKHFPGLGRVLGNTDYSANVVDTVTTAGDPGLKSFQSAINAGVPLVMVSLATYTRIDPKHLAIFSPTVMQQILRKRLHFTGVIISDDMGAAQAVAGISPGSRAVNFLADGGDLITSVSLPVADSMESAVLKWAAGHSDFRADVNAAVMKVLAAKQSYGLLPCSAS